MAKPGITLTVDARDLDKVAANIAAAGRNIPRHARTAITRLGQLILRSLQREAPVKSGRLRDSLHMDVVNGGMGAILSEGVAYGKFVREGTGPHAIYPRSKRALYWPGASHPVRMVNHPGTKANAYHERAVRDSRSDIEETARELGTDIAIDITKPV